jgi:hypothetical protein
LLERGSTLPPKVVNGALRVEVPAVNLHEVVAIDLG